MDAARRLTGEELEMFDPHRENRFFTKSSDRRAMMLFRFPQNPSFGAGRPRALQYCSIRAPHGHQTSLIATAEDEILAS